jgi:hypothetical protein
VGEKWPLNFAYQCISYLKEYLTCSKKYEVRPKAILTSEGIRYTNFYRP